jgi:hypothetical protein
LTTKKIRLDWEVTAEALEDNIEGAAAPKPQNPLFVSVKLINKKKC